MVGTYSGIDAIEKINQGLDWVIIGPALTVAEEVIVRKDAALKTVRPGRDRPGIIRAWGEDSGK